MKSADFSQANPLVIERVTTTGAQVGLAVSTLQLKPGAAPTITLAVTLTGVLNNPQPPTPQQVPITLTPVSSCS